MASGTLIYSAQVIGNNTINATGYPITLDRSGSVPSGSDYRITDVKFERKFRNARWNNFQIHESTSSGTLLSQELDAQTGGISYETKISSTYYSAIKNAMKSSRETICLVGIGGSSGELESGSYIKMTIYWTSSSTAATLSFSAISVNCGASFSATCSGLSSSCTYTLVTKLGSQSTSTAVSTSSSSDSVSISIPNTFANAILSSTSDTATVTLTTKSGTSTVGTSSKTIKVVVPNTPTFKPSLSNCTITPKKTGLIDGTSYTLQNYSYATLGATAEATYGATIKKIVFTGQDINKTYSGSTTTVTGTRDTATFTQSGTLTYTITATDSRGLTNSQTVNITVTAYAKPSCQNLSVQRCTAGGDLSVTGMYGVVQGNPVYTAIGTNQLNVKIEVKEASGSYLVNPIYDGAYQNGWILQETGSSDPYQLDVDKRYTIRFTFKDSVVENTPVEYTVTTAYILMRWEPQNSAFGYGCYPSAEKCVEIAPDWSLIHRGKNVLEVGSPAQVIWTKETDNSNVKWESSTASTSFNLADWEEIEVILDNNASGVFTFVKETSTNASYLGIFNGICTAAVAANGSLGSGFAVFAITIQVNSATQAQITRFENMYIRKTGIVEYPTTTPRGITKIIGLKMAVRETNT